MAFLKDYRDNASGLLATIAEAEEPALDQAADIIAKAYAAGQTIYVFGCTHSAILAEDVFYRAGAPCFWRPLWGPGMSIAQTPGFLTSAAEHNEMLGNDMSYIIPLEDLITKENTPNIWAILEANPSYYKTVIPAGTYNGQDADVPTFGVKCMVICNASMDKDLVYNLAKTLAENTEEMIAGNGVFSSMADPNFICNDLPIPLHEGAKAYYTEAGMLK